MRIGRRLAFPLLGLFLFGVGIAWTALWRYSHRNAPEWIRYELRLPWPPRLLVFSGFVILVIACVLVVIRYLRTALSRTSGQ
jgi:uncharacterized membrane protein YidH (DUF202 family)